MKSVEVSARTIEEAVASALSHLAVSEDEVEVEVLEQPSRGILGFGARPARVRVTVKEIAVAVPEKRPPANHDTRSERLPGLKAGAPPAIGAVKEPWRELSADDRVEIGKDFLMSLLKEMGIEASVTTREEGDVVYCEVRGRNMGVLIGRRGETLNSVQYLVNLVANKGIAPGGESERRRFVIDPEGYRRRREETLRNLARRKAAQVKRSGHRVVLEPMNALERRIIHLALQDDAYVETFSEGKDPYRRVVIAPKK